MAAMDTDLDLICLGRAAVDLYGDQIGVGLEAVQSFSKSLGGCAANVAVGAARQGLSVAMLTRVGDEPMGRFVRTTLENEGVDVSRVKVDPERLTGLVLLSIRSENDFPLLFYRERCADMALSVEDFDTAFIGRAKALLLTGTHLSTPSVAAVSSAAKDMARRRGVSVVLDIDHRPVLWGLDRHERGSLGAASNHRVRATFDALLPDCDLIVGTRDEWAAISGHADPMQALRRTRELSGATLVEKLGPGGCRIYPGPVTEADRVEVEPFPVEVYNQLGAGDAFLAGFLRGWLDGQPWEICGRLGNAAGALVVGRQACAPAMPTRDELEHFVAKGPSERPVPVEDDPDLVRLHRLSLRPTPIEELCVFAIDHRGHFERLRETHPNLDLVDLKSRLAEGGMRGAERAGVAAPGMIIDAEAGRSALRAMTRRGDVWLARPIEQPDYRPLAFEGGLENVDARLRTWPTEHVVKCLVQFHPDGNPELRDMQRRRMKWLQDACVRLERRLMLEILPMRSAMPRPDVTAVPRAVEHLYEAGLRPDWWKLPCMPAVEDWRRLDAVIDRYDPRCQGVLVLGMEATHAALAEGFRSARQGCLHVRGFAVGRTIFGDAVRGRAEGALGDEQLVEAVAEGFARVMQAWRGAQ